MTGVMALYLSLHFEQFDGFHLYHHRFLGKILFTMVFGVKQPITSFSLGGRRGLNTLQQDPDTTFSVNLFLKEGLGCNFFACDYFTPKIHIHLFVSNAAGGRPKKTILDLWVVQSVTISPMENVILLLCSNR